MLKRKIYAILISSVFMVLLCSWGDVGHSMISLRADLSFNEDMTVLKDWVFFLSEHASDADKRKKNDPNEGPKHYIDIDNYTSFLETGRIPQSLDSCILAYGSSFVEDNGSLPWATLSMYDSVVACLVRSDMENAQIYAADLGHYVADGHMPMHITRNYDGQFTDNKGIHFRYEITMINKFQDQINYIGSPAKKVDNVTNYIFNYIYENYHYMDAILLADDLAKEADDGNYSDLYYSTLWENTDTLTNNMFKNASHALAELLYTALLESQAISSTSQAISGSISEPFSISVSPNSFSDIGLISYFFPDE